MLPTERLPVTKADTYSWELFARTIHNIMISDTACVHWRSKLESNSLVAITAMGISMIIMHEKKCILISGGYVYIISM